MAKKREKRNALAKTIATVGDPESQVMTFVTPNLAEEDWQELGAYLRTVITNSTTERSQLDQELIVWNKLYEGEVPDGKTFPWPGASNLHIPLTQEMLDGLHSRLSKAALGVSPLVLVKGQDEMGVDVEYKVERYYESLGHDIDLGEVINQVIFLSLRDGVALVKPMWDRRTRKVKTRKMKPVLDPQTGEPIIDPDTMKPLREEVIEIDDIVEYDNVRAVPVELKDFYLLPSHAYSMDRPYAKGVAERVWMRWDEIYARAKSGEYRMEAAEALKSATAASRLAVTGTSTQEVDTVMHKVQISQTLGLQEYEIFDIFMDYDLDDDGYEEECWFTFAPKFNVMLRAEVFPYWHQLRPYIAFIPWPRPRRFYGFSVPQRLESVNRELNAIHNQRLDAVSLRLSPPILITRSAILRGDASQPWGPAAKFEVNAKDDIEVLTLPDVNPSSFNEENILRQYAEHIVGYYDINTNRATGARRTRAEIGAIQQESLIRFDYMMKLIQRSVVKVFEQINLLKIQYMPEEGEAFEAQNLSGSTEKFQITRQDLMANFRFMANGDLPVADKERNRQEAYFLYGALLQNPLVAQRPDRIHAVTKLLLQAFEVKNIEKVIGTIEELQQQMQQMATMPQGMTPEQMAQGMQVGGGMMGGPQGGGTRPKRPGAGASMAGPSRGTPGNSR